MGRQRYYKPGSFYRICDRTGFAMRAEETQREWQGLIVSREVFEARHPQDFVKGVPDNQTVPYARPRQPNTFVGSSTSPQFQVFGDLPTGVAFEIQNGSIMIYRAASVVSAANYPASA